MIYSVWEVNCKLLVLAQNVEPLATTCYKQLELLNRSFGSLSLFLSLVCSKALNEPISCVFSHCGWYLEIMRILQKKQSISLPPVHDDVKLFSTFQHLSSLKNAWELIISNN